MTWPSGSQPQADDLSRREIEELVLEEYKRGRLTRPELRQLLGFEARAELDAFLQGS
jgi:hypothetical protein